VAIKLEGSITGIELAGDGSSVSVDIDLRQLSPISGFAEGVLPESVLSFTSSSSSVDSVTVAGKILTVHFSSPPAIDELVELVVNFRVAAR